MKYCPYCGTEVADVGAAFCTECGKSLRDAGLQADKESAKSKKSDQRSKMKKKKAAVEPPEKIPDEKVKAEPQPDDGYDGYYDDVRPLDEGSEREKIDIELIKKIALLVAGVIMIVSICVVLIYVQS